MNEHTEPEKAPEEAFDTKVAKPSGAAGYESAFFEKKLKEKDEINKSLVATAEAQAEIIGKQYDTLKNLGEKIFEVVQANNEFSKIILENIEALPNAIDRLKDEIVTMQAEMEAEFEKAEETRIGTPTKLDSIHHKLMVDRFMNIQGQLEKTAKVIEEIRKKISKPQGGFEFVEERVSSFEPGGDRGYTS